MTDQEQADEVERVLGDMARCIECGAVKPKSQLLFYLSPKGSWWTCFQLSPDGCHYAHICRPHKTIGNGESLFISGPDRREGFHKL